MSKPIVVHDLDGCLCDTGQAVLDTLHKSYGLGPYTLEDVTQYRFEDCLPGVTFEIMTQIFMNPDFWYCIKPLPDVDDPFFALSEFFDVHIVTDRRWYPELEQETKRWLRCNDVYYNKLVICKGKEKADYARSVGATYAIEDSHANAELLGEYCVTALLDRPWNHEDLTARYVLRHYEYANAVSFAKHSQGYKETIDSLYARGMTPISTKRTIRGRMWSPA